MKTKYVIRMPLGYYWVAYLSRSDGVQDAWTFYDPSNALRIINFHSLQGCEIVPVFVSEDGRISLKGSEEPQKED